MEPTNKKIKVGNAATSGHDGLASFLVPTKTVEVFELPTKTHDGGTLRLRSPKTYEVRNNDEDLKHKDPFLYYSNEANRFSYLLGLGHSNPNDNGGKPEPRTEERKTRLSFEVHPDLLLSDKNSMPTAATNLQLKEAQ